MVKKGGKVDEILEKWRETVSSDLKTSFGYRFFPSEPVPLAAVCTQFC